MTFLNKKAEDIFFHRQKEIIRRGCIEEPIVFDAGANEGQSICSYLRLFPRAYIHSFEPIKKFTDYLELRWIGDKKITINNLALSDTAGMRLFHLTNDPGASSLLEPTEEIRGKSAKKNFDFEKINVPIDTLDNYCEKKEIENIDILKIDVQGTELSVLRGAEKMLGKSKINLIYLEIFIAENYKGQCELAEITFFLKKYKYSLWDICPYIYTRTGQLWSANVMVLSPLFSEQLKNFPQDFPENL